VHCAWRTLWTQTFSAFSDVVMCITPSGMRSTIRLRVHAFQAHYPPLAPPLSFPCPHPTALTPSERCFAASPSEEKQTDEQSARDLPAVLRLPRCRCIDRWLITGQAHQRRRCPLCNTDPIETVAVTCPPGARAGDHVRVIHESEYTLTIPAGVGPGQVFHANLPARNAVAMRDCPGVGQTEPSPLPQPLPDSAQALRESDGPSPPSLPASPPGSASGRSHAVAHNSGQGMVDIGSHRESNATTDADGGTVMNWLLQTWRGSTLPAVSARPRGGTDVPRPENASEDGGQRELRA